MIRAPLIRPVAVALIVATATLLAACGSGVAKAKSPRSWAPAERHAHGLRYVASTEGKRLLLHTRGGDVSFLTGVDIGATTPGHAPGELAIPRATYRRWFKQIGALGIHVVRIYTIHRPAFYDELASYNRAHPNAPVYVVQGVYLADESYFENHDLFAPAVHDSFRAELVDAVKAVHGQLVRRPQRGRASGTWRSDISRWVTGYIIGVEWDPATFRSDLRNAGRPAWKGRYFSSKPHATPTERWLAEMLDVVASQEASRGWTMPLAFANWPPADPLRHPTERHTNQDSIQVDANHVAASPNWTGGYFASYHVYPYYPDFLRYEKPLQRYRYRGRFDAYAGYLAALRNHHPMPTVISEFGVPSSMGSAHKGVRGRDQGDHSEQEAMAIDGELLEMMHALGLGGAFVFAWSDEWFKATWNTVDHQLPADRRALWHSAWTNEQHFGLVASDPGKTTRTIVGRGSDEWTRNGSSVLFHVPAACAAFRRPTTRLTSTSGSATRARLPVDAPRSRSASTSSPEATAVYPVVAASGRTPTTP